jgi:hypothetical protein
MQNSELLLHLIEAVCNYLIKEILLSPSLFRTLNIKIWLQIYIFLCRCETLLSTNRDLGWWRTKQCGVAMFLVIPLNSHTALNAKMMRNSEWAKILKCKDINLSIHMRRLKKIMKNLTPASSLAEVKPVTAMAQGYSIINTTVYSRI